MAIGLLFWILMLIWLVFGSVRDWPAPGTRPWPIVGLGLQWILFAIIGWQLFGPALHK